ncbi:MAG TPA: alpha/beta hydrolase [Burkholderiales bacterium]|jgi:arylformamidase
MDEKQAGGIGQDDLDAQYNPRLAVPAFAGHIAHWAESSKRVRLSEPGFLDIPYGDAPGQTLDFFPVQQNARSDVPLLVFIHGGYWRALDKSDFSYVAPSFTHAGAAVAVINYRLISKVTLEDLVRDVLMAVTWCYLHAGHYGANPHHIYATGHSAGGHLAAMLLAAQWPRWHGALPAEVVRGALSVSGLHDLEPVRHAPFIRDDLALDAKRALSMSPAFLPPATHASLLTAVGGDESAEFKRQSALIGSQWKNVFMGDVSMPGFNHFTVCTDFGNRDSPLVRALLEMMFMSL